MASFSAQAHLTQKVISQPVSPRFQSYTHTDNNIPSTSMNSGSDWFIDSGATHHVTSNLSNLHIFSPYKGNSTLLVGNGSTASINHIGSMRVPTLDSTRSVTLNNILHVPCITKNLISISQFLKDNSAIIEFNASCCLVKDLTNRNILLKGQLKDGLYHLDVGELQKLQGRINRSSDSRINH